MINEFSRTTLVIGTESMKKLENMHIAVFGVGGVGGFALEALARSGVKTFTIIDNDTVSLTNINRQLIALHSTIGKYKVDVFKERLEDINPNITVHTYNTFYTKDNANEFSYDKFDYIIDAIDTISSKILLAELAQEYNIPIISSMGAGNKLDPKQFYITDIYKTSMCPLAKVMRKELRKRDIKGLKVVCSQEKPIKVDANSEFVEKNDNDRISPGSVSFVPSVVGFIIASEIVREIVDNKKTL